MSQLHLYLVKHDKPAPLELDAAARLTGADCHAIADEEVMESHATKLMWVFGLACVMVLLVIAFMPRQ